MITNVYVQDLPGQELKLWCSCISCGKSYEQDHKMIQLTFKSDSGTGTVINLCDKCRKELYEIL